MTPADSDQPNDLRPETDAAATPPSVGSPQGTGASSAAAAPDVAPPPPREPFQPREAPRAAPKSPRAAIEPTAVPPPPPRRRRSKAARNPIVVFLNGAMSLLTFIAVVAVIAAVYGKNRFEQPGPLTETKVVLISKGSTIDTIGDTLQKAGVVSEAWIFALGTKLLSLTGQMKAGEYEFHPGVSMAEVAEIMVEGRSVQHTVTFPEGWSSEQVVARLNDEQMLATRITAIPEEGSLLPETYKFTRGDTKISVLEKMRREQDRRLAEIWKARAEGLPLATPRDLVILASIVEKETAKPEERARIAAVFVNRLRKNMRLETDPTVLYGLYGGKAWVEGRTITRSDLAAPNPYNTYRINGLPPGPIANPGRAAMEAVANPAKTNELFFVADGTGGHVFAETLDEHNKNVQRWRQIEQQRRSDAPAPGATTAPAGSATAPIAPTPLRQNRSGATPQPASPSQNPATPAGQFPAKIN
ncbi:endolytic transglycosylase MltG [Methyloraptor flagellatus]|uniref:Endolytic murein transglycosylase n=1 Tax=Methyloraptor flagellatus TaxID=3162530 RepID=A0AAU7XGR8_9HYPH